LNLLAIHLPDIDLAAAVLTPENVAVAIAVEVTDALDVPVVGDESVLDSALRLNLLAGHLPEIDLAAAVLTPENVAVAIAIEVTDALEVPIVSRTFWMTATPFSIPLASFGRFICWRMPCGTCPTSQTASTCSF
jgi:hypothetical protein